MKTEENLVFNNLKVLLVLLIKLIINLPTFIIIECADFILNRNNIYKFVMGERNYKITQKINNYIKEIERKIDRENIYSIKDKEERIILSTKSYKYTMILFDMVLYKITMPLYLVSIFIIYMFL